MSAVLERLEENMVKLTITISPELLEKGIQKAYANTRNEIHIPGFRKGKVPRKLIESQYGKEIFYDEAVENVISPLYEEALLEYNIDAVSKPKAEVIEISAESGATVDLKFYVRPEAKIVDYNCLRYKAFDTNASEDEINAEIDKAREKNSRIIEVDNRSLRDGDIAVLDFTGYVDGETFQGGSAEGFQLEIGSGSFIDTFEQQLIGMDIDEDKDVFVTFPENYGSEELKGKPAMFKVKLIGIKFKELPVADDELAKDISEFDTLEEYKNDIRGKIERDKLHKAEHDKEEQTLKILADITMVDIPEPMIETEISSMISDLKRQTSGMGIGFDKYLEYFQTDENGLRASYRERSERTVKVRLALEAVAKKEGCEATEEEIDAEIREMALSYQLDPDKVFKNFTQADRAGMALDIKVKKALKIVLDSAVADTEEMIVENE